MPHHTLNCLLSGIRLMSGGGEVFRTDDVIKE